MSTKKTAIFVVTILMLSLLVVVPALAVHDQAFQLDGDISPVDQNPGGPGNPTVDWQDMFDVSGNDVPTPKDALPANFITAFFSRDFVPGASGPDRTTFATGSKDTLNITPGWQCARDNNVNDKTDLVNVYATAYVDPGSGELKLYFALERYSNDGAGNVAFWILQDGTVDCVAPASGPSTTDFTGNHKDGDILIVSEFTVGGTVSSINAYEWVGDASGSLETNAIASGADCKSEAADDDICATVNTSLFTPPWLTETKQPGNTPSNDLDVSEFFEGGISLTALNLADRCFNRILADTRSSPSLTATIFDYAIGSLPLCDLKVTKDGDTLSKVGDDVNYTITIENTGGVTLYKQSIVDNLLGDLTDGTNPLITSSDCGASLAAGASCTIKVTREVQATDTDPLPNTVTVVYDSRSDLLGDEVTREDSHSVNLFQPAIAVAKTGDTLSKVGDDVNYTITLSNNSSADTPDMICTATDSLLGTVFGPDASLPLGDTVLNLSRTVQEGDPDPLDNTVTLTCSPDGFPNVLEESASHSVNLFQPAIAIAKTGDELSKVGDPVDYTITLSNNSSADTPALTCKATDSLLGVVFNDVLPSGDTVLNLSRTVQEGDPDPLVNSVSMTCSVAGFPNVLNAGPATHSVNLFQPAIAVAKTGDTLSKVGDDVNYTITLSNNSSADTPDMICTATDSLLGTVFGPDVSLPLGDTVLNLSRTVQEGDPDPLDNTVTLTCSPDGFPNVLEESASHSVNLFQPAIAIAKTGDALSKVGDPVDYTITLSNNSSADTPALTCTATDSLLGVVFNGVLPLGDKVLNLSRTVQEGDPDPLVNSASMTCSIDGFPNVLDAGPATHSTNLFQPAVEVLKTGPDTASRGETITYNFTINNLSSGDSPDLILASVTDTVLGDLTATASANGCDTLAPGGSCSFTFDYTIAFDDPSPLINVVTIHYNPYGFPNDITDYDDHSLDIPILGCTPGFWQGGAGVQLWDQPPTDPQWPNDDTQPFYTQDLFNTYFNFLIDPRLDGLTMLDLVGSGGTSDSARRAARDMVAAYLNESAFPVDYPADSLSDLLTMWYDAVAGGDAALDAFHVTVSAWNNPEPPGYCPLP